jgi:hypothetical protein
MAFSNRIPGPEPRYWMDDLKVLRRDILLHAGSFLPGPDNQQRQIAVSLRSLLENQKWLDAHTLNG